MFLFAGHANIVKLLLDNGADRNIVNKWGKTALARAEEIYSKNGEENYKQIVDMLNAN